MKSYKNKTTGEIAKQIENHTDFYAVSKAEVIPKRFIENSCDWEEVVEKDYEILSFLNPDNKGEYTLECGVLFAYVGSYRSLCYCMLEIKSSFLKNLN